VVGLASSTGLMWGAYLLDVASPVVADKEDQDLLEDSPFQ